MPVSRHNLLSVFVFWVAGAFIAGGFARGEVAQRGVATTPAGRPNVLMICVDDLKPLLGCYGDEVAKTPHIDALASRGVRFDAAYCNQAVCSPSRNSLMTGLRPQTIGVYDLPTHFRKAAPDVVTMTQYFIGKGYHAAGLSKIYHVGHGNIDDAASWSEPWWRPKGANYLHPESLAKITPDSKGKKRGPATESADVRDGDYTDGQTAMEAVKRLSRLATQPDQPFFLAVGFIRPHLPFTAPTKYWDLYDATTLPMPAFEQRPKKAPDYAPTTFGELRNYSDMRDKTIDAETTRHLIHGYYAATSYVDAQIGLVLDALRDNGLAGNTLVILWGDHGWHLGDHGMWCKHTNYEQAARIPVIVSMPGGPQGVVAKTMIETVDIYPTLAELAALPQPAGLDGQSFAPAVFDPAVRIRDHVTHVYPRGSRLGRAIRDARYRMVQWKAPGGDDANAEFELYDYQTDPLETLNIAEDKPEIVADMMQRLIQQGEAKPQYKTPTPNNDESAKKSKVDRKKLFDRRDADADGFLTFEEFMTSQPDPEDAKKRFPKFDQDGDGRLSPSEFIHPDRKISTEAKP